MTSLPPGSAEAAADRAGPTYAWVIERGDSQPSAPTYWGGHERWSQDHMDAVRFARKQDAERVACRLGQGYHRLAEHAWVSDAAAPARQDAQAPTPEANLGSPTLCCRCNQHRPIVGAVRVNGSAASGGDMKPICEDCSRKEWPPASPAAPAPSGATSVYADAIRAQAGRIDPQTVMARTMREAADELDSLTEARDAATDALRRMREPVRNTLGGVMTHEDAEGIAAVAISNEKDPPFKESLTRLRLFIAQQNSAFNAALRERDAARTEVARVRTEIEEALQLTEGCSTLKDLAASFIEASATRAMAMKATETFYASQKQDWNVNDRAADKAWINHCRAIADLAKHLGEPAAPPAPAAAREAHPLHPGPGPAPPPQETISRQDYD